MRPSRTCHVNAEEVVKGIGACACEGASVDPGAGKESETGTGRGADAGVGAGGQTCGFECLVQQTAAALHMCHCVVQSAHAMVNALGGCRSG